MKTYIAVFIGVLALLGGFYYYRSGSFSTDSTPLSTDSYKDVTIVFDEGPVRLSQGYAEESIVPDSATKVTTRIFGNELRKDLNGDGREDVAYVVVRDMGGSGVFYYAAASIANDSGYEGTDAVLLGDRIAPQSTTSGGGRSVVFNFATRAPGESFSQTPSEGASVRLQLDSESLRFGIVANDFEGEADPAVMSFSMKTWVWIDAVSADGTKATPKKEGDMTIDFKDDGSFSATTDCNNLAGQFRVTGNALTFSDIASTMMYCEGAKEGVFVELLSKVNGFSFTSRGELLMNTEGGGTLRFR